MPRCGFCSDGIAVVWLCAVPPQAQGARPSESNKKLREQLEEVRRTVADAKAQVKAATTADSLQAAPSEPVCAHLTCSHLLL